MCITITVGERGRRVMGLSTTVINIVLIFLSLALFALAVAIRFKLDDKLELLEGYDSGALSYYLMVIAGIMFFCHLVAANFCYNAAYLETRSEKHHVFVTLIFVVIALFILVVISHIVLAVHSSKLRSALYDGIYMSMKTYGTNLGNKIKIDKLHMEYECCGADELKEWFHIPWVRAIYVNVESDEVKPYLKDGEFVKDDAPFSCCSKYSKRACVHHSVLNAAVHRNYEGHTLYHIGCVDALMDYFSSAVLTPTGLLLLVVLILQAIDVAVMRLLQTSIFEAEELNDPEGASSAYCIKGVGGGGDNREYFKRKKDKKSKDDTADEESDKETDEGESESEADTETEEEPDDEDDDKDDDKDDDEDKDDDDRSSEDGDSGSYGGFGGGGGGGRDRSDESGGSESESSRGDRDDDDDDKGDSKKSKKDKKREKEEKKEEKKRKKEEKKKNKEEKKKEKKEKKEEKKAKKADKKKEKKEKKEKKKTKKKEKKEKKKQKKLEKKKKAKEKKAKKKEKKAKKKREKKEKKAKKKAEKAKKKRAKKEAKAKKKAEKKKRKKEKKSRKKKK